jgi:hypothetical protein
VAWFKRGRGQFRPHELAVLDAVRAQLTPEAVAILDNQIGAVAMVQRLQDEREVNTYTWRFRRPDRATAPAFPAAGDEVRLATVKVVGPRGGGRAEVWLVGGQFFSIAFDKPPRSFGPATDIRSADIKVEVDPMKQSGRELTEQQLMAEISPSLLDEYENLRRDAPTEGVSLLPPEELYGIDINGRRFVVLALLDGDGVIAARSRDGGVARFFYGEERPETYPDLGTAIKAEQQSR